jgi:hypothetical protein
MPEFFRSTAKKPGATKVRKGYKEGSDDKWIQKAKRTCGKTNLAQARSLEVKHVRQVLKI